MKNFRSVQKVASFMLLAMATLTFSSAALAGVNSHYVQITVKGTVAGAACTVVGGSSQTVVLGNASPSILSHSNSSWVWKTFTIGLEHCPTGMSKATITFTGEPDPDNALYYKNIAVASDNQSVAENVAIELNTQVGETQLNNGSKLVTLVNGTTHQAQFDVKARMVTPSGNATAGIVKGHIDYTVEYQ